MWHKYKFYILVHVLLHHIIVTCAVASQYIEHHQYKRIIWGMVYTLVGYYLCF